MNEEQMRAEFEAAAAASRGHNMLLDFRRDAQGEYMSACEKSAWWAWQASRAALVVELPEKETPYDAWDDGAYSHNAAVDDCRAAIEAAGITVKPS